MVERPRSERSVIPTRQIRVLGPTRIVFHKPTLEPLSITPVHGSFLIDWGTLHRRYRVGKEHLHILADGVSAKFGTLDEIRGVGVVLETHVRFSTEYGL